MSLPGAPKILLVEDSATIRHLLEHALEAVGCSVVAVDNGADVVGTAQSEQPAVVILNKMLPGMDGYAVLAELRRNAATSRIKVMMLTEARKREDVMKSIEGGADDYVVKPFDPQYVAQRVSQLAQRARPA